MISAERSFFETFPRLAEGRARDFSQPVVELLRKIVCEDRINRLLTEFAASSGLDFVEHILDQLKVSYRIANTDRDNIPVEGRRVVVANHPPGVERTAAGEGAGVDRAFPAILFRPAVPRRWRRFGRRCRAGLGWPEGSAMLKDRLAALDCQLPTLHRHYVDLCEPDGVRFLAFGTDPAFGHCVDGLIQLDLAAQGCQTGAISQAASGPVAKSENCHRILLN